jgi:hypothetical protein
MGMVMAMVNAPQGDSASAFTTAMPSPARAMTTMNRMATIAVAPATGEISLRAMSARDLPPRRTDEARMMKSWVAPANTTPSVIHRRPGQESELRGQHGPDERTCPRDGREVMPEQDPLVRGHVVVAVGEAVGGVTRLSSRAATRAARKAE